MARSSAGILLFRTRSGTPEVLLVHPGGPFWARRDAGAWSIPKGEHGDDEDPLQCALREFAEETGSALEPAELIELGTIRQKAGKLVTAWAAEGDLDPATVTSNTFTIQWPPRSGRMAEFPEVDRAEWFALAQAREKLVPAQAELVDRLQTHLEAG
jgi:predicted NUDIX family NTP pyrophosphohydrolase